MAYAMTLDEIKEETSYSLASMADCSCPDSLTSPGARMLDSVRDSVVERIEDGSITFDDFNDRGQLHEIADNAPSVYTHERWSQFLDLCAYNEEPEFDDGWPKNLTEAAAVALYQIADRLAHSLCEAWREGWECPTCGDVYSPNTCDTDTCVNFDDDTDTDTPDAASLVAYMCAYLDQPNDPVKAPDVPVEALPIRTPGVALAEARAADMAVLTGPVDLPPVTDHLLSLIDQAEATDMGMRMSRAAMAHDRAVSRFRRKVWTVAGVLAVAGVFLAVMFA